jgi:hypothetical protein
MKNSRKLTARIGVLFLGLMILGFTACSKPAASEEGSGRMPVNDNTYVTIGFGKSTTTPIQVATTFANNTIVDISYRNQRGNRAYSGFCQKPYGTPYY